MKVLSFKLSTSYVKYIERDNSQNWSIVSHGITENGKKGDHQLIVIIPNDFSQKVLDVDNRIADPSIINI
ncbi:hypothetical protein WDV81_08795 [Streptococcus agalactiae]